MANTYVLISSNTLSSSAASVTFSSIPSTYTDLVLRVSSRDNNGSVYQNLQMTFNSNNTNYSATFLYNINASSGSGRATALTSLNYQYDNGNNSTANTFSNIEIYIPSYTASINKQLSSFSAVENNSTTDYLLMATANLWRNTSAINSITLNPDSTTFLSGSSFYLYGIKNS